MGGMGTIHAANDALIYADNHTMTQNIISAALNAGVSKFFYASSACVYPESLQTNANRDVMLRESDTWSEGRPRPQGLYGQEKLVSELYLQSLALDHPNTAIRIARFHNVYGPGGSYDNGKEKAPAALLRKALAIKLDIGATPGAELEVWGDGVQRRSFLYIDDAVEGVLALLASERSEPTNIGSDRSVAIKDLAVIAIDSAGLSRDDVTVRMTNMPGLVGVASRNADLTIARDALRWEPKVSLEEGMKRTASWMLRDMQARLGQDEGPLQQWKKSRVVDLAEEAITFAILLPITSRGQDKPERCLENLATFAASLMKTTSADLNSLGQRFALKIYLAIDHDDPILLSSHPNPATKVLHAHGFFDVDTLICNVPRGYVCSLWRTCARRAFDDGCDYYVLMGDDIILEDRGWMRDVHDQFTVFSREQGVPFGIGCVAFTDLAFPGMPTFPVVHRVHMEIFDGVVVPEVFVNQDGDPFLFQLYRRWGCSAMMSSRLRNTAGGELEARYSKVPTHRWTSGPLSGGVAKVDKWLSIHAPSVRQKLTLDVVVPSYRVQVPVLNRILTLPTSDTCSTMFIIIVDDPKSQAYHELMRKYGVRPDVRIRKHEKNLGASAARNRGLFESSADWVHFLDDDVVPEPDILLQAEAVVRANPNAAGFVGDTKFPVADTSFKTAVHLASVTYFWSIATRQPDLGEIPWGVTANIIVRRNITDTDDIVFDLVFPKTGGGEDIDYCIKKEMLSKQNDGVGFKQAPKVIATHPWWHDGARSYWRFWMWSKGDGALIRLYPELSYRDFAPNGAEALALTFAVSLVGVAMAASGYGTSVAFLGGRMSASIFAAHLIYDTYEIARGWSADRRRDLNTAVTGIPLLIASLESTLIRLWSEIGRLVGIYERREWSSIGRRFDWFTGKAGHGPRNNERFHNVTCVVLAVGVFGAASKMI
jgi:nucleoside-diphosphate-sugar epimerase/GT2 family glycosyltransferase